jgi:acetyltransferase-like isoleucine patch superfamily enzyme
LAYEEIRVLDVMAHKLLDWLWQGRVRYYLSKAQVGRGVSIRPPVVIFRPRNLVLGDDVRINAGCVLQAQDRLEIGSLTMIAAGCIIATANHDVSLRGLEAFGALRTAPVRIGSNCWLGAGVIVLPGVTIGDGTVVGAGSVVTGDLPAEMICYGVPARPVRPRPVAEKSPGR